MKKFLLSLVSLTLCASLAFSLTFAVSADVIWEPDGNSFYQRHSDECHSLERTYTVPAEVSIYNAPGDLLRCGKLTAGDEVVISMRWNDSDNTEWGYVQSGEKNGWTQVSALTVVYDYISFEEEHDKEIVTCNDAVKIDSDTLFFNYPGSQKAIENQPNLTESDDKLSANKKYTDSDGNTWYFCSYFYGLKNFWFTSPTAAAAVNPVTTTKPSSAATTTKPSSAATTTEPFSATATTEPSSAVVTPTSSADATTALADTTQPQNDEKPFSMKLTAVILVAVLAVCMAVLIPVIMKKRKK